jgi:hypothetical protein
MQDTLEVRTDSAVPSSPAELAKLIRKLRWIGLDDEARRLQLVMRTLPVDERGSVSIGPFSTD